MQEVKKEDKYLIISNGRDLVVNIHNIEKTVTSSGQTFMLIGDSWEEVCDLFYSEYTIGNEDEIVGEPYEILWHINYDTEEEAQQVCDLIMSISDKIKLKPIQHPVSGYWATPYQVLVFNSIPDGDIKNMLLQKLQDSEQNKRTRAEMEANGWF